MKIINFMINEITSKHPMNVQKLWNMNSRYLICGVSF